MTPHRHVLMTADTIGGVWTYSIELARALCVHDIRVSLATMGAPVTLPQREEARSVPGLELFESSYKVEWMQQAWDDVDAAGEWLAELERELKPDVIHLNGFAHGAMAWAAPSVVVGHSCVLSWWNAVRRFPAPTEFDEYRRRVSRGLRHANAVVAVSQYVAAELQRYYGQIEPPVAIYNGRDAAMYRPSPKDDFVFSCGRLWDEAKNILSLDRAAEYTEWPVYVAGEERHPEGGHPTKVRNVHTVGKLTPTDLQRWYARAAIYALPARYEPFGLSVVEAALSSCALVLGDIPSLREIWRDSALFVPPDDHEALAEVVNDLIRRKSAREGLARAARFRALLFTPARMADRYLAVYRQAHAGHSAAGTALSCAS